MEIPSVDIWVARLVLWTALAGKSEDILGDELESLRLVQETELHRMEAELCLRTGSVGTRIHLELGVVEEGVPCGGGGGGGGGGGVVACGDG